MKEIEQKSIIEWCTQIYQESLQRDREMYEKRKEAFLAYKDKEKTL